MLSSAANPLIGIDPDIRFGRPCIAGTRISVNDVLGWLSNGMSIAEIIQDFPELTPELIQACQRYAADRKTPYTEVFGREADFQVKYRLFYLQRKKAVVTRQPTKEFAGIFATLTKRARTIGWCIQNLLTPMAFLSQTGRLRRWAGPICLS